jgi:hypothetical protein
VNQVNSEFAASAAVDKRQGLLHVIFNLEWPWMQGKDESMKRMLASSAVALVTVLLSQHAAADEAVGRVTLLGCHNTDNMCWVEVEGFTGTPACGTSYQFRWDAGTAWGSRWYATLLAAKASGNRVRLEIASYCSAQGYPTFLYGSVID